MMDYYGKHPLMLGAVAFFLGMFVSGMMLAGHYKHPPDPPSPLLGASTEQTRIDRAEDGAYLFARQVPGGCLYIADHHVVAFAPFPCAGPGTRALTSADPR